MATITKGITTDSLFPPYTVVDNYRRTIDERLTEMAKDRDTKRLVRTVEAVVTVVDAADETVSVPRFLDAIDPRLHPWLLDAIAVTVAAGAIETVKTRGHGPRYQRP